jgi:hypothetical protein
MSRGTRLTRLAVAAAAAGLLVACGSTPSTFATTSDIGADVTPTATPSFTVVQFQQLWAQMRQNFNKDMANFNNALNGGDVNGFEGSANNLGADVGNLVDSVNRAGFPPATAADVSGLRGSATTLITTLRAIRQSLTVGDARQAAGPLAAQLSAFVAAAGRLAADLHEGNPAALTTPAP